MLDQRDEAVVAAGFDAVATRYGEVAFLRQAAEALVNAVSLTPVAEALDVATGPGTTAMLLAQRICDGRVTAIDISPDTIETARGRATSMRLHNVTFTCASATALPFEAERFDLVTCSSAIYYMPDFAQAVAEWTRVLRPGGTLAFSTFGAGMLEPMSSLFDARVRAYGVVVPQPTPLYRLTSPKQCRQLLESGGLERVRVEEQRLGDWIPDAEQWWATLMSTGFRLLVASLEGGQRAAFKREHTREVASHVTKQGLWLNVPVITATGIRP